MEPVVSGRRRTRTVLRARADGRRRRRARPRCARPVERGGHDDSGRLIARGVDLPGTADTPISRLTRHGQEIAREDIWPGEEDLGRPVILPGGEIGILLAWWNAPDESEWCWRVEFYNHR